MELYSISWFEKNGPRKSNEPFSDIRDAEDYARKMAFRASDKSATIHKMVPFRKVTVNDEWEILD